MREALKQVISAVHGGFRAFSSSPIGFYVRETQTTFEVEVVMDNRHLVIPLNTIMLAQAEDDPKRLEWIKRSVTRSALLQWHEAFKQTTDPKTINIFKKYPGQP
jgi:hypothetical protein